MNSFLWPAMLWGSTGTRISFYAHTVIANTTCTFIVPEMDERRFTIPLIDQYLFVIGWNILDSREISCFCEYVDPKTANWVLTFCGHESLKSPRDSLEKNVMEIVFKIKIKIFCVRKSVIIYEHIFMCSDICVHI